MEQLTCTVQKAEIRKAHENPRVGARWVGRGVLGAPRLRFPNQASKDVMLEMISHTPSRSSRDLPYFHHTSVKVMKFA